MNKRVDYDAIAQVYDYGPHREKSFDPVLCRFLSERPLDGHADILDIGCGTGAQLEANRKANPKLVCMGLDASLRMLQIARARDPHIRWVQGNAAALPFGDGSFDYVSNQFALHHFARKRDFFAEVARVLRAGGRFVIRNLDPWSMADWVFYRYFPLRFNATLGTSCRLKRSAMCWHR